MIKQPLRLLTDHKRGLGRKIGAAAPQKLFGLTTVRVEEELLGRRNCRAALRGRPRFHVVFRAGAATEGRPYSYIRWPPVTCEP